MGIISRHRCHYFPSRGPYSRCRQNRQSFAFPLKTADVWLGRKAICIFVRNNALFPTGAEYLEHLSIREHLSVEHYQSVTRSSNFEIDVRVASEVVSSTWQIVTHARMHPRKHARTHIFDIQITMRRHGLLPMENPAPKNILVEQCRGPNQTDPALNSASFRTPFNISRERAFARAEKKSFLRLGD